MAAILPLCTLDEVRAELADTERSIDRLDEYPIVDRGRRDERMEILTRWRVRLRQQVEEMEATDA